MRTDLFRRLKSERGNAILETAMTLPLVLLVSVSVFEFGRAYQTWQVLTNAAREGARVAVLPNPVAGAPEARVRQYMASGQLPNADSATVIVCTGGCAATWPPLVAPTGPLQAPAGLSGTLSALDGPNGHQVLYNGHPLYTYSKDMNSGDAFGDGVGGKWSAATPDLAAASAY